MRDSLMKLSAPIWKQKTDSSKISYSELFQNKFQAILSSKESKLIPLDSIKGITRVASDDEKLRIYTWNVPLSSGLNKYFGLIQMIRDSLMVIRLESTGDDGTNFLKSKIQATDWYGAIYYKLIQIQVGNNTSYTLLGWDGYTNISNRKIIDILNIDANGKIEFGMPVFKTANGLQSRIVFEFAENASMLLRYDYQAILIEKRKKVKREFAWLIIMDRLIPMDPSMKGFYKYYVPAGDTYDGYIFRNGYWSLVEDVDVRNKMPETK